MFGVIVTTISVISGPSSSKGNSNSSHCLLIKAKSSEVVALTLKLSLTLIVTGTIIHLSRKLIVISSSLSFTILLFAGN